MNSQQKALIQTSFLWIVADSMPIADAFYQNLFSRRPDFQGLFTSDRLIQKEKFLAMLGFLVSHLYDDTLCEKTLATLAQRHMTYGVKQEDYESVGEALISALQKGLSEAFTPEVEQAWRLFYEHISVSMINAAYSRPILAAH